MKYLTSNEMARVDEKAMEYGLGVAQLMENVGNGVARFVLNMDPKPNKVIIVFGKGNNGGDGLASARHLLDKDIDIELVRVSNDLNENTSKQLDILKKLGLQIHKNLEDIKIEKGDIIVDSLLGFSINGNPRGNYKKIIRKVNRLRDKTGIKVISLDLPSGLNPDTGEKYSPCINSDYILTFGLPKKGLEGIENVYTVNIGIPNKIYSDLGIKIENYFRDKNIIKIS